MKVDREPPRTTVGSAEWFSGNVFYETYVEPTEHSQMLVGLVRFAPAARTTWHSHARGQTIYIVEGIAWVQRRGGRIEIARAGARVVFEPFEEHWHGAAIDSFMSHLAMYEIDDRDTIGNAVTDQEYRAGP